ncbi:RNA-binding protein 41 [Frankliniella fusca]|uniref:RNA-binding protein 41 n=1 Tax=Frankliniella fusca TaxID=407009 RepID=A0AAE1GT99_9NEOP|nr:RNA-binding protein 41 [Frankliniella fusca]
MAAVRGSGSGGRGRGRGRARLQEGEAPEAHVAEEGKRVIRDLVARQTDTAASLELQRAREGERQFRRAAAVLPLDGAAAGTTSLQDFAAGAERARRAEELAGTGLPLHDLQLLLEHEGGAAAAERLTEPERLAREERLRDIQRRMGDATAAEGPPGAGHARHVQELSSSLRLDGEMSPFVKLALDKAKDREHPEGDVPRFRDAARPAPEHPVHRLADLERGMFGHLDASGAPPPPATSRKRRRQRQVADGQKSRDAATSSSVAVAERGVRAAGGASLWDVRSPAPPAPAPAAAAQRRPHGPARPKQYTVVDGRIVELRGDVATALDRAGEPSDTKRPRGGVFIPIGQGFLSLEDLEKNRLSVEEIRRLPRFASYEEGTPSAVRAISFRKTLTLGSVARFDRLVCCQVLYVKNLEAAVTEDDLAAVFGSFRAASGPSPILRLCGGRMRGQAFVTFSTVAEAGAALRAANGYVLRGKPLIVQYGRGQGC